MIFTKRVGAESHRSTAHEIYLVGVVIRHSFPVGQRDFYLQATTHIQGGNMNGSDGPPWLVVIKISEPLKMVGLYYSASIPAGRPSDLFVLPPCMRSRIRCIQILPGVTKLRERC